MAESIRRRSLMILEAWERLRARRNPGTAMAASKAMIATTIMISTRVKPPRLVVSFLSILGVSLSIFYVVRGARWRDFLGLVSHNSFPATPAAAGMTGE